MCESLGGVGADRMVAAALPPTARRVAPAARAMPAYHKTAVRRVHRCSGVRVQCHCVSLRCSGERFSHRPSERLSQRSSGERFSHRPSERFTQRSQ